MITNRLADLLNLEGVSGAWHSNWPPVAFVAGKSPKQGIDDLADIEGLTDEKAGALTMAARNICWFGDEA